MDEKNEVQRHQIRLGLCRAHEWQSWIPVPECLSPGAHFLGYRFFSCCFLRSLLNLLRFYFCLTFWFFGHKACGISVPQPLIPGPSLWIHLLVLSPVMWLQPHLTQVWTRQAVSKLEDCACSSSLFFVGSGSKSSQGHPPARSLLWPSQTVPPTMGFHSTWADPVALNLPTARQLLEEVAHDSG